MREMSVFADGVDHVDAAPPAKPSKTTDEAVAQLLRGYSPIPPEAPRTITYSFRATAPAANDGNLFGDITAFQRVTAAQMTAVQTAMQRWAEVANVTFQQVFGDGGSSYSDSGSILIGNYTTAYTGSGGFTGSGGIWFNASGNGFADVKTPVIGSNVYEQLYVHELGHVLGLAHPSNYDSSSGKVLSYAVDASYREDDRQYSVMSYFDASNTGGAWSVGSTTPMLHDIAAVQRLYGANSAVRAGDTQYGFFGNAGEAFTIANNAVQRTFTIWDGGGTDYLNMSGYTQNQTINLQAEVFSSTGSQKNNIVIARNVTIENANGGSGSDTINGNDVDNILDGGFGAGRDVLKGLNGNDTLYGWDGGDRLDGGFGYTDKLYGGTGDDTYVIDDLNDVVTEYANEGRDEIVSTIRYVLPGNVEDLTLVGISNVNAFGNELANFITGNSGNNYMQGFAGLDTLAGGAGNDYYEIGDRAFVDEDSGYRPDDVIEFTNGGTDTVSISNQEGNSYVMPANVENAVVAGSSAQTVVGNELGNSFTGNASYNLFYGQGGNDTLDGGAFTDDLIGGIGNDLYILNDLNGDNNFSVYRYDNVYENVGEGIDTVQVLALDNPATVSTDRYTLGANIENGVIAGTIAFNLVGNELNNSLTGNAAANTLTGNAGNDVLNGAGGVDSLIGGVGNDTYVLTDLVVANEFELYHYDYVTEGVGEGTDTVIVTALDNPDTISTDRYTLGVNIENGIIAGSIVFDMVGNALDNSLTGNAASNRLIGNDGNDTLAGLGGHDILTGGLGNDTYVMDASDIVGGVVQQDLVQEAAGAGIDTVVSSVRWVLDTNVENLILTGAATANGFGNALDNSLTGNSAYNYLDGGAGYDTLAGGGFDDYYNLGDTTVVSGVTRFDRIIEAAAAGIDTVAVWSNVGLTSYTMTANVEKAIIMGTASFSLSGNDTDNTLTGNAAINTLYGQDGNDLLDGSGGVDKLVGGLGNDTFLLNDLARLNDFEIYHYDYILEAAGEGIDTVLIKALDNPDTASTERYTLGNNIDNATVSGTLDFNLTGNNLANVMTGNAGANTLIGLAGNDSLNGGAAVDHLVGGAGDDTYVLTDLARSNNFELFHYDYVAEAANEGTDTVIVTALDNPDTIATADRYTLGADIENGLIVGNIAFNMNGNGLNNDLTGNVANNLLNGLDGNDLLAGGGGRDTLAGGTGDDTYFMGASDIVVGVVMPDVVQEAAGAGTDTIISSVRWVLDANVENLILTGGAPADATGNALANAITGNAGANFLDGGLGYDSLAGGAGDDTYWLKDATSVSGVLRYDRVTEAANAGIDTVAVQSGLGITGYSLGANIESGVIMGGQDFNLAGNELDNRLLGNAGANRIYGDIGADTLYGGMGNDVLNGGAGGDIFFFSTTPNAATNLDSITDFSVADDTIWLDHTVFAALLGVGATLLAADFVIGASATNSAQNIVYDSSAGKLYYDADGLGGAAQTVFATLAAGLALTNNDFFVT